MPLSWNEIRRCLCAFAPQWQNATRENADSKLFCPNKRTTSSSLSVSPMGAVSNLALREFRDYARNDRELRS
jgi:hypothetical protein